MTYGEYQKYLADGGWQAVSMHNEQIAALTAQVNGLRERVTALEEDRSVQRVVAWVVVAVVGAVFILLMTGVP